VDALLRWYRAHRRDLPWRRTSDPWAIWVSEVMLQQTRVETVLRYWGSFLERFPTPASLAAADEQEVLSAWAGLGYYRRARNLRLAAGEVVQRYGGRVPASPESFSALPGVGDYTAGAVLSIAFDQTLPAVDGNVARVLARLHRLETEPGSAAHRGRLRELAGELVRGGQAGEWNQALMELGALVCVPAGPRCDRCPVQGCCEAHRAGVEATLPRPKRRARVRAERLVAGALIDSAGRLLLARRPEGGLLAGMWELPGAVRTPSVPAEHALRRALSTRIGVEIAAAAVEPLGRVRHLFTHRRWDVRVFRCLRWCGEPSALGYPALRWAFPDAVDVPLPAVTRKTLACL